MQLRTLRAPLMAALLSGTASLALAQDNPMVGGAAMPATNDIVTNAMASADHTTLVAAVQAELERREAEAAKSRGESQSIGFGSQIRSYVVHPYTMVKDLRSGHETGNAQGVLDGDLDGFIRAELERRAKAGGAARLQTWLLEPDRVSADFYESTGWAPDGWARTLETGAEPLREIRWHTLLDDEEGTGR